MDAEWYGDITKSNDLLPLETGHYAYLFYP